MHRLLSSTVSSTRPSSWCSRQRREAWWRLPAESAVAVRRIDSAGRAGRARRPLPDHAAVADLDAGAHGAVEVIPASATTMTSPASECCLRKSVRTGTTVVVSALLSSNSPALYVLGHVSGVLTDPVDVVGRAGVLVTQADEVQARRALDDSAYVEREAAVSNAADRSSGSM